MPILLIYGGAIALLVILGILFYLRSVSSRKRYVCPQCGEQVKTELMDAAHCNTCGAPLGKA